MNAQQMFFSHRGVHRMMIACVIAVAWVLVVAVLGGREPAAALPVSRLTPSSGDPIASESQVFRTEVGMMASAESLSTRRPAHPRTLATWRALRAYPGAPPRIPHGLSASEYREGACQACHEKGGFSVRFNAYVPVTPHPELGQCMQCHLGDAKLMGVPLPGTEPSASCGQCHTAGGVRAAGSSPLSRTTAWPSVPAVTPGRTPPPIPHDSPMRVNCLACHAGPAAVAELRTAHPERANCRQCHVQRDGTAGGAP